ncbi:transposase, partial [Methylorubrum rhodesianum]|uniref:transposase n=1 Tax=Methylorubrum rhodesianum TaxID=29427 RepID=UPI001FEED2B1
PAPSCSRCPCPGWSHHTPGPASRPNRGTAILIPGTNPLERLNKEIKRRADVVGIFPNTDAIQRLIGAVLLEANDEWQLQHRYMQIEGMAGFAPALIEESVTTLPPQAA